MEPRKRQRRGFRCVLRPDVFPVGIDAAIGLGTTELRKKTGLTGAPLYTLSGLEQFGLRYRNYLMTVSFDGAPPSA